VTLAPPELKVNVEVLIVAGSIALLNVALITGALGEQTRVEPLSGFTEVTVGGVRGLPGCPAFLSASPHPAIKTANRNAGIQILLTFNLRISFSSSPSYKAFHASMSRRRDKPNLRLNSQEHNPSAISSLYHLLSLAVCAILNEIDIELV
jgi:hypothetical protein